MKQLIIALLLLCSPCLAQQGMQPQDQKKHYLTIVTHDDWKKRPDDMALVEMLRIDPMNKVARMCHFNHYTPSMVLFQDRLSDKIDTSRLPAIMYQKPGEPAGAVVYLAYGDEIPTSSQALFDDMKYFSKLAPSTQPMEQFRDRGGDDEEVVDQDFLLSSPETWGRSGSGPIRDSIAGGVQLMTFVFALGALLGVLIVMAIALKIVK